MIKNELIHLYLITGFLGSGKTTLLKNLLQKSHEKKVGILVNEFGKVGIDGTILKQDGVEMVELNNGSIFCSCLEDTFMDGLAALSKQPIEYLIIEASGLSDPASLERILQEIQTRIGPVYDYRGMICVADAPRIGKLMKLVTAVENQIINSNLILLNKMDLVNADEIPAIEQAISELNPNAKVIETSYCTISDNVLETNLRKSQPSSFLRSTNTPDSRPDTLILESKGIFNVKKLEHFVQSLAHKTYRIKGYFYTQQGWLYIDGIESRISQKPVEDRKGSSQLVLIFRKKHRKLKIGTSHINTLDSLKEKIQALWSKEFTEKLEIQ